MRTKVRGQLPKFSIRAVTLNKRQGTGGELLELEKVQLPAKEATLRPFDKIKAQGATLREPQGAAKHPNHGANGTINVLLPNMQIRKVHLRLITRFNGMKVI